MRLPELTWEFGETDMQTGKLDPMVLPLILRSLGVDRELRSQLFHLAPSIQSSSNLLVVVGGGLTRSLLPESQ